MNPKWALLSLMAAASSVAQRPAAAIVKHTTLPAATVPVAGYVLEGGTMQIRPILGTAAKARLGDPIPQPPDAGRLYLPPRQQYVLVETTSSQPIAVWTLLDTVRKRWPPQAVPLSGALAHADLIAFSPRGDAAALYSQSTGQLQVVAGLPAKPVLIRELSLAGLGQAAQLALSDDGALAAAQLADNQLLYSSQGGQWQPMSTQHSPGSWSFVPNTHDLAIADLSQGSIAVYREVAGRLQLSSVHNLLADRLSFTKDGLQLLAGSTSGGTLWSLQLASGALTAVPIAGRVETLSCLRDGWTFLLSSSPSLSLVKVLSPGGALAAAGQSVSVGLLQ